ncbi:asparaginase-domain-containing protein [Violaceomyces palustris]|uniref:Asparaginase-domain-containing protein n=1 Tax=Violaceomyces palustris TaxID=1673888 RepID=A0ACD0NUH2_9BASI|nr:asparaginase-domain-containing protein [Violaceomyces palustris]
MTDEALVLCLYAGGTIGMVRQDANSGFAPYPSFLTETLRSQSRFHDPHADSIFSWSDSVDRYKTWSEVYTRPSSGATTPSSGTRDDPSLRGGKLLSQAASKHVSLHQDDNCKSPKQSAKVDDSNLLSSPPSKRSKTGHGQGPLDHIYSDSAPAGPGQGLGVHTPGTPTTSGARPFGHPVLVRSSAPQGTSTHHAVSSTLSPDGSVLELQLPTLITPRGANGKRVRYAVLEYDPLLDSSEMDMPDWIRLSKDIALNYKNFDSFIVLHGTDTMAYTSSALSMLLENLGKSVIVTGAQVPLSQLRNDAIENVLGALTLAGSFIIPEVCLYFASKLYRGNRVSKVSNNALAAFDSPNMSPLARVGISIEVSWNLIERPKELLPFRAHDRMDANVAVLRLFPGLPTSTVKSFLSPPLKGVVLESYGAGNAPSRSDLLQVFKEASDRGLVIVNITQCMQGEVSAIYAVGKKLEKVGVVAGSDMTPECALAKLSYLLGKEELSPDDVRELMSRPLRGELTPSRKSATAIQGKEEEGGRNEMGGDGRDASSRDSNSENESNLESLLAHILKNPQRGEKEFKVSFSSSHPSRVDSEHQDQKAKEGRRKLEEFEELSDRKISDLEILKASLNVLPQLIYQACEEGDDDMLEWHLKKLNRLTGGGILRPTISISEADEPSPSPQGEGTQPQQNEEKPPESTMLSSNQTLPSSSSNIPPIERFYPLHVASKKGHLSTVKILLRAGCSVHLRDDRLGSTPMFLAARNSHKQVVQLLKNSGAHLMEDEVRLAKFLLSESDQVVPREDPTCSTERGFLLDCWRLAGVEV